MMFLCMTLVLSWLVKLRSVTDRHAQTLASHCRESAGQPISIPDLLSLRYKGILL